MAALILTLLFVAVVVINALFGLIRGLNKSVIRIMTLVLAVILTFVIAGPVSKLIASKVIINGESLGQLLLSSISGSEMIDIILDSTPLLKEAILVIPAFGIALVVFPVMFFLLKFITWIVFLCVQKPLRKLIFKDNCDKQEAKAQPTGIKVAKRFGGMGVGIVTGMLIFGMIMTPILGLFSILPSSDTVGGLLDTLVEQDSMPRDSADMIKEIYSVTDGTFVSIYGAVGFRPAGEAYLNSVSKIEANGYTSSLSKELTAVVDMAQTVLESGALKALSGATDPNAIYAMLADKTLMDAMMQSMFQSKLLCSAVPELTAYAMETVASAMKVPASKEVVYTNMMDDVAKAVKDADIDYAAIKAYEDANNITGTVIQLNNSTKTGSDVQVMTKEEYEAAVAKLVDLAKSISTILNKSMSGNNQTFTDSVAVYLVKGVQAQAKEFGDDAVANLDANMVQTTLSAMKETDVTAEGGNGGKLLEQLQNKEKFETDVATVESIKSSILESVKTAVEDEGKASETASALASVVSDFAGAVSSATDEKGNMDVTKLDFGKIASAVTTLQNSPLKGVGSTVLDIVSSGDLGSNSMISDTLNAVKEGYEKGEDIGGTINTAGALIGLGSAMGNNDASSENKQEAMVNSLTGLINNLNEFTISLLPKIISPDTLVSMGLPKAFAEPAYSVVETLLKELMKLKGADNYDNEVGTILHLYNLATSGVTKFTEDDIIDLIDYTLKSDAIYNTIISITDSNPFGIKIENPSTLESIVNTIEHIYEKSEKTEKERNVAIAIAKLLGVEKDLNLC